MARPIVAGNKGKGKGSKNNKGKARPKTAAELVEEERAQLANAIATGHGLTAQQATVHFENIFF